MEIYFADVKDEFVSFKNGVDIIASTAGSILSCNIVTPILRNEFASREQKNANQILNTKKEEKINQNSHLYNRVTMQQYQQNI